MGTRCADHVTPLYPQKLALTSATGGGRSVGIVRSRTKATEFSLVLLMFFTCDFLLPLLLSVFVCSLFVVNFFLRSCVRSLLAICKLCQLIKNKGLNLLLLN